MPPRQRGPTWLPERDALRGDMAADELALQPQISEIPRLIDWVEACCRAAGIDDELRFKMALVLEEAVANVVAHAFAGLPRPHLIRVRLDITERLISAEVSDNGHPFDPTGAPGPDLTLPLERRDPGGLGIHLMRSMMDRLQYRRDAGSNILHLEKRRS